MIEKIRDDWGWSHWSNGDLHNELLIVFVHGIFSDAEAAWREVAAPLLRRCASDVDVFSFQFPSRIWQEADVERAATDLATALAVSERRVHRHLIFVCHSTGGLVVKAMLRNERAQLEASLGSSTPYRQMRFNVLRTRRIINLDVPHKGGHRLWSRLGAVAYCPAGLVLRSAKAVSPRRLPMGENRIIRQLRHGNPWLHDLERDFLAFMRLLDEHALPRPVSVEYLAPDDPIVHRTDTSAQVDRATGAGVLTDERAVAALKLRGSHSSFKNIKHDRDIIASLLHSQLAPWIEEDAVAAKRLTEVSFARIYDYHTAIGFSALAGQPDSSSVSAAPPADASQAQVTALVRGRISRVSGSVSVLLITGAGGAGKSVAVRTLARTLTAEHFTARRDASPIVLFLPLERVRLRGNAAKGFESPELARWAWDTLLADWCEYVRGVFSQDDADRGAPPDRHHSLHPDWVNHQVLRNPAVVILDGVEEFLSRNALDSSAFIGMLRDLRHRFADNDRLTIVLAVRSTMPGLQDFVPDIRDRLVLRTLTPEEADALEPGARAAIEKAPQQLRELLLRPLIFFRLRKDLTALDFSSSATRTSLMRLALESVLLSAGLGDVSHPTAVPPRPVGRDELISALAAIAWEFHSGFFGEMSLDELLSACVRSSQFAPFTGFALTTDRGFLSTLLERSVFFLTKPQHYRVLHAEWESYLVAEHVAAAFRARIPMMLAEAACDINILEYAGELLSDIHVSEDDLRPFLEFNAASPESYAMGNLVALLADGSLTLEGPAMSRLVERFHELNPMAIHVFVSAFGTRALQFRDQPEDGTATGRAASLAQTFPLFLRSLIDGENVRRATSLTRSLAWCLLASLEGERDLPPRPRLPEMDDDEAQRPILGMISDVTGGRPRLHVKHRTLQRSFLGLLYQTLDRPERLPTLVHYLYLLVVARRCNGHIADADRLLPPLLAPSSALAVAVRRHQSEDLDDIFDLCCRIGGR